MYMYIYVYIYIYIYICTYVYMRGARGPELPPRQVPAPAEAVLEDGLLQDMYHNIIQHKIIYYDIT